MDEVVVGSEERPWWEMPEYREVQALLDGVTEADAMEVTTRCRRVIDRMRRRATTVKVLGSNEVIDAIGGHGPML